MRSTTLTFAMLALAACGDPALDQAYRDVLAEGGDFEQPENKREETIHSAKAQPNPDDPEERWVCIDKTVGIEKAPDAYATFDPNSDVIYPGSLLQGSSLSQATPEPVAVDRAGGTVTIDLVNGSSNVSVPVEEVTYGSIQTAMNEILASNNGQGAARFVLETTEVQSKEELAVSLGVNVDTLTVDFDGRMSFSSDREYNRWVVKLTESYYTMTWSLPTSLTDVFAPTVSPEELGQYVQPGNPAAYVASVTYGRVFYLLVESTASRSELEASVNASYKAAVANAELDADVTYVTDLANAKVKVFALGGDPSLALATFSGSFEDVRDFLTKGGDITTGRPLSYKLRAVTNNQTVSVKVATEYDVTECTPVEAKLEDGLVHYDGGAFLDVADDGFGSVKAWGDAWGDPQMEAIPDDGALYIGTQYRTQQGYQPAVTMYYVSEQYPGAMRWPGQVLRNTDYTLFVTLANYTRPDQDETKLFTWGDSFNAGQGLQLGFSANDEVFLSHGGDQVLYGQLDTDSQARTILFTFWFSQTEGSRIYANGELIAEDPTMTTPLAGFSGATIGAADDMGFKDGVADFRLYHYKVVGQAMSEFDRADHEQVMLVADRI